jgi:hypothetical protein
MMLLVHDIMYCVLLVNVLIFMYRKVFSSFVKNHSVTALKDDLSNLEHLSTSLAAELFKDPRLHKT